MLHRLFFEANAALRDEISWKLHAQTGARILTVT